LPNSHPAQGSVEHEAAGLIAHHLPAPCHQSPPGTLRWVQVRAHTQAWKAPSSLTRGEGRADVRAELRLPSVGLFSNVLVLTLLSGVRMMQPLRNVEAKNPSL